MRFPVHRVRIFLLLAILANGLSLQPSLASSGTASAAAPAAAPSSSTPATPADKPDSPTIIPGSPLAALTGAAAPPKEANTPAPFGTDEIGFALATVLGSEATKTFGDFTDALKHATRLTPVLNWLTSLPASQKHRAQALSIAAGLAIAILPGIAVDALLQFLLRAPMAFCAKHGAPRKGEELPNPDLEGLENAENGESEKRPHRHVSLRALFRRALFALLRFILTLIPVAAFGTAEQIFLSFGLVSSREAHMAVVGFANAYIVSRIAYEIFGLLLSPRTPNLRFVHLTTHQANWAMRRVLTLILSIFFAFCLISLAEILGLSKEGGDTLVRLAALIVHLEIAAGIWQSRRIVSRWIAGPPSATGFISGFRQRFAKVWFVFAIFYVLAVWVAWAGGVRNALGTLLWAVLVVILALVIGRLAWKGTDSLLNRLFPNQPKSTGFAASTFGSRAKAYNPLIRVLLRVIIAALVLLLMLQGWGVAAFNWLLQNATSRILLSALTSVLITVTTAIVLWEFVNFKLDSRVERLSASGRTRQAARLRTLAPMMRAGLGVIIVLVTLIICLSRIGVNTTGLLAVSSVVGIAVGFGSQKLVQDIITGLFLLFEDAMQVGDVVSLGGMSGTVERLSIRTIRLRGSDGSINIIPFSSVSTVTNQTRDFNYAQISIMVSYDEDIDKVNAVLKEIGAQMRTEPAWGAMMRDDLQLYGLDSFDQLGLVFTGQIRTGPGQHWAVRREFYARVQKRFQEEGIELSRRSESLRLDMPPGALEQIEAELPSKPGSKKSSEAETVNKENTEKKE